MRAFVFALQTAVKSIWNEKWINLLTILSVSVGLLILSAFITVTFNVDSVLKKWSKSFGLVVYLDESLNREAEDTLRNLFKQDSDIVHVKYISKEQALQKLQKMLGPDAPVIDELGSNPLPSSFELKLKETLLTPDGVTQKANEISHMSGVAEVQYGEKWLSSLNTISKALKISTTFLGIAIFVAIVFITYNTIKVFFYRRKDEIDTMKLLGATRTFIRMPFLVEGFFIGLLGGIIGSATLLGLQSFISLKGAEFLPAVRAMTVALPVQIYLLVPLAGAVMSVIGSFIAVGKIRY